jgi:hypothetical protein
VQKRRRYNQAITLEVAEKSKRLREQADPANCLNLFSQLR